MPTEDKPKKHTDQLEHTATATLYIALTQVIDSE